MPSISTFYGITIYMYFLSKEHNPSHIHAFYGGQNALIDISDCDVIDGHLPKNALRLVKEWVKLHKDELQTMWDTQEFKRIPPLDEKED